MSTKWRREVQVPLGVLSYAGTATPGRGLAFNARLGVWHEVAAVAPSMRGGDTLRAMKNTLLALPRGPAVSGAAAVLLLSGLLMGWVSSLVREGGGTPAPSVGSPSVMGVAAMGGGGTPEGLSSQVESSAPPQSSVLRDAAAEPVARASPGSTGLHGAGESPELVPSRVLQAARSPVLASNTAVGHGLPAAPRAGQAERLPVAVASGVRRGDWPAEHLALPRAASRGHEPIAGAALAHPAPRRAHAASHQRAPRAEKKPVRSTDTPGAGAAERGRPVSKPEGGAATADFRLAPFGALSGRPGVAGRDVLVAIKDASTVIVANQRGMPTPFRLGEKLPSGAVLLSIHPRLESAETDRGVIRLE